MLGDSSSTLTPDDVEEHCTKYNPWLDTLFALLPYIIRLVQCVRRHTDAAKNKLVFQMMNFVFQMMNFVFQMMNIVYSKQQRERVLPRADTGELCYSDLSIARHVYHSLISCCLCASPPQLYNALKYSSCILVTTLSWLDHMQTQSHANDHIVPTGYSSWKEVPVTEFSLRPYHVLWLLAVVFCTTFKLYWDVVHDFGFTVKFWELRPKLLYPRKFYCAFRLIHISKFDSSMENDFFFP